METNYLLEIICIILLAIAYLLVNAFIWHRASRLLRIICKRFFYPAVTVFTIIYAFMMSSIITWTAFEDPSLVHWLKAVSNIWIGVFIYCLVFIVSAEIVTLVLHLLKKVGKKRPGWSRFIFIRGVVVAVLIIAFSTYGMINWQNLRVTEYSVDVDKHTNIGNSMKIVLVADTHIGYTVGKEQIDNMVKLINEQNPDIVCIAGDIIDNDYAAMEDPDGIARSFRKIKSRYGVYASYGNHDVYEKLVGGFSIYDVGGIKSVQDEVDDFIADCNIEMLEDDVILVDDMYIVGRVDESTPNGMEEDTRKTIDDLTKDLDKSKFIIDIDHEPSQLQEKADAGVDIDLGGHTHDGQIFPGNLTINLWWDNACGLLNVDKMYSIVTSGVGVWGPAMRVGANPEISVINVNFTK